MKYASGYALQKLDPTAFRCAKADYESEELGYEYQCGECKSIYDDKQEAEDCCMIECEECGTLCETEQEADEHCPETARRLK
jgi:hypothetical protein